MKNKLLQKRNIIKIAVILLVLVFLFVIHHFGFYERLYGRNSGKNYVKFLSVGQNDCTVVCSNDKFMLIDAGGAQDEGFGMIKQLYHCGVREIEYIVITHQQNTRAAALPAILEKFKVNHVVVGENMFSDTSDLTRRILKSLENNNVSVTEVGKGDKLEIEGAVLEFLWYFEGDIVSENYLIPALEMKSKRFVFGNDVPINEERKMVAENTNLKCDVLKASRHGGASSNCEEFILAADPDICIISCGEYKYTNFPSNKVIERLKKFDIDYMTTFESGNITFDLNEMSVTPEIKETQPT